MLKFGSVSEIKRSFLEVASKEFLLLVLSGSGRETLRVAPRSAPSVKGSNVNRLLEFISTSGNQWYNWQFTLLPVLLHSPAASKSTGEIHQWRFAISPPSEFVSMRWDQIIRIYFNKLFN